MQITEGTQTKVGSCGYIVAIDMTDYDINSVLGIQAKTTAGVWSDPVISESAYDVIAGYVENPDCPDMAFTWLRNTLYVFLSSTYTFEATTLLNVWYYRNAQNITTVSDIVDIPGEWEQLAIALILRRMYVDQNTFVPQNINQQIRTQCINLGIRYPI